MPVTDPVALAALLVAVVGAIFAASRLTGLARLFAVVPPVLWCYFVPMLLRTAGALPASSPVYDGMSSYGLLVALFLMMLSIDLRAIRALGWRPLALMLVGTIGIVLGGIVAYLAFRSFLPDDAWMGLAALSGSWIGGTANLVAIKEGIGAPDSVIAPIIVVDTVVGYGWMAVMLALTGFQKRFDKWVGADPRLAADLEARATDPTLERVPSTTADLALLLALGLGAAVGSRLLAAGIPPLQVPMQGEMVTVISTSTWAILLTVTAGLALSFTRMRRLESVGAGALGYYALYLLLSTIGAQADLAKIGEFPAYMGAGVVWMLVHILVLFIGARLMQAPLFLAATASMANVGGVASAPIVASAYNRALAPVGVLLGVTGYILGIYFGFLTASLLAYLSRL